MCKVRNPHHTNNLVTLNNIAFSDTLTEAEEALLDMLEAEYLARLQAEQLEAFDYYSTPKIDQQEPTVH